MSKRENRATVKETALTGAFAQGLNEGMRLVGYVIIIASVGQKSVTRTPIVAVADVPEVIGNFLGSLRADDYAQGVEIKIMVDENAAPPAEEPLEVEDGIEEAEVVEE